MLQNMLYKNTGNYCAGRKKNISKQNSSARRTKENRLMLVSNCAICREKKSRFTKNFIKQYSNIWYYLMLKAIVFGVLIFEKISLK